MTTWILVADEFRARLFKAQAKDGKLEEIADITHPEGRMHEGAMTPLEYRQRNAESSTLELSA